MPGLIARSESLAQIGATPDLPECWIVGGAVRDLLLGRRVKDVDLAVAGDAKSAAQLLHRRLGGDIFAVSERFGTWRVLPDAGDWQIDVTSMRGESIDEDLSRRDFTANALAVSAGEKAELLDPYDGQADIERKTLRVLGAAAYEDDPLRPLRLARFAATLGFEPDAETAKLTADYASRLPEAAPERVFAELRELMRAPGVLRGLELLDELGLTAAVLPELRDLRGVEQSAYHHLDAHDHTVAVLAELIELENDLETVFGDGADALGSVLSEPLADEMTRGGALRWAALLHDIAKRETRVEVGDGRIGFPGHDKRGAEMVRAICARLHTSEKFSQYVAALTRHHLRLGFLVHEQPLDKRAEYRYLSACDPVEVEVGVLSVADRRATRGRKADEAIAAHTELAAQLNAAALAWRENRDRQPLVRGDALASALGIEPGPRLGELLAAIEEERYAGSLTDEQAAIEYARSQLGD